MFQNNAPFAKFGRRQIDAKVHAITGRASILTAGALLLCLFMPLSSSNAGVATQNSAKSLADSANTSQQLAQKIRGNGNRKETLRGAGRLGRAKHKQNGR